MTNSSVTLQSTIRGHQHMKLAWAKKFNSVLPHNFKKILWVTRLFFFLSKKEMGAVPVKPQPWLKKCCLTVAIQHISFLKHSHYSDCFLLFINFAESVSLHFEYNFKADFCGIMSSRLSLCVSDSKNKTW